MSGEKMKEQSQLNLLLNELVRTEESFKKNAQTVQLIFQQLRESYPEEHIFEQYDQYLRRALPIYEKICAQIQSISQQSALNSSDKINHITALYSSELYTHSFSNFILFYRQFESWGGEVEYEKWMHKSCLFSSEIMQGVYEQYTPMIFIQRLSQLSMLIHECAKLTDDPKIQSIDKLIRTIAKEINRKRIKIEIASDISHLLSRMNEKEFEDDQKKIVQLFIENQLYEDVEFHEINEKVKEYFALFSHEILMNLCKQIEEVKVKLSRSSSKELIEFHGDLKEKLFRYLAYGKNGCLDDHSRIHLAEAVLADKPLTSADHKKLLLMRDFADSFTHTPSI